MSLALYGIPKICDPLTLRFLLLPDGRISPLRFLERFPERDAAVVCFRTESSFPGRILRLALQDVFPLPGMGTFVVIF